MTTESIHSTKSYDMAACARVATPACVGIAGLIVAVVGLVFTLHTGGFGTLSRAHSIIVIGSTGIPGLIACVAAVAIGLLWPCKKNPYENLPASQPVLQTPSALDHHNPLQGSHTPTAHIPASPATHVTPLEHQIDETPLRIVNTWCRIEPTNYFNHAKAIAEGTDIHTIGRERTIIILEQLYLQREDVVLLNYEGQIHTSPPGQTISFGILPPIALSSNPDDSEGLSLVLQKAIINMYTSKIPKLFVPIAAAPSGYAAHGILLVIEVEGKIVKITAVDPLGRKSGYQEFADTAIAASKSIFHESVSVSTFKNLVEQQTDNWSCSWQLIENIKQLGMVENVQSYVKKGQLPVRPPVTIFKAIDSNLQLVRSKIT